MTEKSPETFDATKPATTRFRWISIVGVAVAALVIGYFAGREHLKYELRSAMSEVADRFREGIAPPRASTESESSSDEETVDEPKTALTATLISKTFHESNPQAGDFEDAILIGISFRNETGKDVRAFDGVLTFTDLLDNKVISSSFAINEPIAAGQTYRWDGSLDYNQFMDQHQRLRAEDTKNLKLQLKVGKVLFADGKTETFD
jgi:hypothetical protein